MFYGIGDIHGHYQRMASLLQESGLIDSALRWVGGTDTLVFMGDFVDRGPDAANAIALAMRLQTEAAAAGGQVLSVIGNHDLLLSLVARYPDAQAVEGLSFSQAWRQNGGVASDLTTVSEEQFRWLMAQPVMLRLGDLLITHADALYYYDYGRTIEEVNGRLTALINSADTSGLARFNEHFNEHRAFWEADGAARAEQFLATYGGAQLWHGHTPISKMRSIKAADVIEPLIYADGLCVNLDGGIYLGGPGFIHTA